LLVCVLGETLGVPIHVFGPETHMTAIVGMALGKKDVPPPAKQQSTTANFLLPGAQVINYFPPTRLTRNLRIISSNPGNLLIVAYRKAGNVLNETLRCVFKTYVWTHRGLKLLGHNRERIIER